MTLRIHNLDSSDIDAANEILVAAFQSARDYRDDLRLYLAFAPQGWYMADWEGVSAGMVGVVNYGPLAYIGFMAVHPDFQRRRIAESLMIYALSQMQADGCSIALLDASVMGEPLYRKLGFVEDDKSAHYILDGTSVRKPADFPSINLANTIIRVMQPTDIPKLTNLDTPIFGASRERLFSLLLNTLPQRSFVAEDASGQLSGYVFSQTARIGPCAALDSQAAEGLLQAALSVPFEGQISFIAPGSNPYAEALIIRYGFEHFRTIPHMRYGGTQHPGRREFIYSLMSFAIG